MKSPICYSIFELSDTVLLTSGTYKPKSLRMLVKLFVSSCNKNTQFSFTILVLISLINESCLSLFIESGARSSAEKDD